MEIALAEYVELRARGANDEASALESHLIGTISIGDTPEQQVAADAMARYLASRQGASAAKRTEARREAVETFLAAIERETEE